MESRWRWPPGDVVASLGNGSGKASLARFHEIQGAGHLKGAADGRLVGALVSVGDVAFHRALEQEGLLGHIAEARPQVGLGKRAQIGAVEGDGALRRVVEALDELHDGGFARTGGAYDGQRGAGLGRERHMGERGSPSSV